MLAEEQFSHGLKHAAGIVPIIDRLCVSRGVGAGGHRRGLRLGGAGIVHGAARRDHGRQDAGVRDGARIVAVPSVDVLARTRRRVGETWSSCSTRSGTRSSRRRSRTRTVNPFRASRRTSIRCRRCSTDAAAGALLGEGIPYHEKFIPKDDPGVLLTEPEAWQARASAVAELGARLAREGQFADPMRLTPIYIRRPEAEEKFEERQGERFAGNALRRWWRAWWRVRAVARP